LKASVDQSTLKVQLHLSKARLDELKTQMEAMTKLQGQNPAVDQGLPSGNVIK